jgi:hypothetical protein
MALQYLDKDGELDSLFMSAGERALNALAEHGLVTILPGGRCGRWTDEGLRFLRSN